MWVGMPNERFLIGVLMKYIFIDFDGTIMNSHTGEIPQSTYDTINELQAQGHRVVITTGRNIYLLEDYPQRLNISWVSGSNGRFLSKDLINLDYEDPIPKQTVMNLIKDLKTHQIDYVLSTHNAYVTHQKFGPSIDLFSEHFKMQYPQIVKTFEDYDHIFQINVFSDKPIPKEILNNTPLSFLRASHHGFDVTMGNALKEKTLEYVHLKYHVKQEDIIAIGDGLNDIGMIQYAGFGIAMGNASEEVKAVANYVTESIDNEGFYQAFKFMGLVK